MLTSKEQVGEPARTTTPKAHLRQVRRAMDVAVTGVRTDGRPSDRSHRRRPERAGRAVVSNQRQCSVECPTECLAVKPPDADKKPATIHGLTFRSLQTAQAGDAQLAGGAVLLIRG
jgi:hypothetical protein